MRDERDPFLVLSIGRCATTYFAACFNADHEPTELDGDALSPRHLFLMTEGWKIPKNYRVVIFVRDAKAQMLSIMNRAAAKGAGKLTMFREKLPAYLRILNNLVRDGAQVYSSDDLLQLSEEELAAWALNELGVDSIVPSPPLNGNPNVVDGLPPWAEAAAAKMQKHYDAWLDAEALEFDADEPDPTRHEIRYEGKTYRMDYVFPAEIAALRARKSGQFQELPVLQWLAQKKLGGIYIDCGAHIGNHSLFFANHCPSESVIAIEAHPKIFELMQGNINRNVKETSVGVIQAAAWSKTNEVVKMQPIPHNNAGHTCIRDDGVTPVKTVALDDMIQNVPEGHQVTVLKIDVEDVEVQVIQGARELISRYHPVIIAERHDQAQLQEFEHELAKIAAYNRVAEWSGIHTFAWEWAGC